MKFRYLVLVLGIIGCGPGIPSDKSIEPVSVTSTPVPLEVTSDDIAPSQNTSNEPTSESTNKPITYFCKKIVNTPNKTICVIERDKNIQEQKAS